MIVSQKVKIKKAGNKNLKYYIGLGYIIDDDIKEFWINVDDLTPGSKCLVEAKCDFCNNIVSIKYHLYLKNISSNRLVRVFTVMVKKLLLEKSMKQISNLSQE